LMNRRFTLDKHQGKVMGVSSGLANYLGWDVTLIRLAWVLGTIFCFGALALVYLVVGLVSPES
jgi:phage shock protein C